MKPALAALKRSNPCTGVRACGKRTWLSASPLLSSNHRAALSRPKRGGLITAGGTRHDTIRRGTAQHSTTMTDARHCKLAGWRLPVSLETRGIAAVGCHCCWRDVLTDGGRKRERHTPLDKDPQHHRCRAEKAPFDTTPRIPCRTGIPLAAITAPLLADLVTRTPLSVRGREDAEEGEREPVHLLSLCRAHVARRPPSSNARQ